MTEAYLYSYSSCFYLFHSTYCVSSLQWLYLLYWLLNVYLIYIPGLSKPAYKYVSQDLTFLYLVGPLSRSSRPMQWAPHPQVCSKRPFGACHPWLQSRVLRLRVVTSSWPRACVIQCPRPSYKRGCFGPRQSVSLWLSSQPHHKVPSCDFPRAMPYVSPPLDKSLHHSLSSFI